MLRALRVIEPETVTEAAGELRRLGEQAKVYAGGAELLLLLRHGLVQADYLVNIKGIKGLDQVNMDSGIMRIGSAVTHRRLEKDLMVRKHLSMFAHAESQVANVRVRNQGTVGGNLCFNDPHSDSGTALWVYEAGVKVQGGTGERRLALEEFLIDMYSTALRTDEILTEIEVAPLPAGFSASYLRIHRYQRPTLGVAAAVKLDNGVVGQALACGGLHRSEAGAAAGS